MKKSTKQIIQWSVLSLFVLVGGIAIVASGNDYEDRQPVQQFSAGILQTADASFDFETISMKDGKVSHDFVAENSGEEPVIITKVYTSCMCTAAQITDGAGNVRGIFGMPGHAGPSSADIEVAPGERITIEAIFDPAAHGPSGVGLAQRSVYLETNSGTSPKLEFSFQATVMR
ncbi:MAG: DUF1573 domain-containing protein [bacterium]|nr:DUF1573 domain-containing protein [bacterium]